MEVRNKLRALKGCSGRPGSGVEGSKVAMYCRLHADCGMLNVCQKYCTCESYNGLPTFGSDGKRVGVYCRLYAEDGMVDVRGKGYAREGSLRQPICRGTLS